MKILICGSRTFTKEHQIDQVLSMYASYVPLPWVVHGAAKGADQLADKLAPLWGMQVRSFPADWDRYGKRAGYVRNQQMLDEGQPDVVYAFVDKPLQESRGTDMMVRLARDAGIPTYVIYGASVQPEPKKYKPWPNFAVRDEF